MYATYPVSSSVPCQQMILWFLDIPLLSAINRVPGLESPIFRTVHASDQFCKHGAVGSHRMTRNSPQLPQLKKWVCCAAVTYDSAATTFSRTGAGDRSDGARAGRSSRRRGGGRRASEFRWAAGLAVVMLEAFRGRDDQRGVAVGLEPAAKSSPGAVMSGQFQGVFDPAHQVVGQDGDPYVGAAAPFELVSCSCSSLENTSACRRVSPPICSYWPLT